MIWREQFSASVYLPRGILMEVQPPFVIEWLARQSEAAEKAVQVSVVIPAYNEELRLPPTLIQAIDYLEQEGFLYEIIVVDDGSRDGTSEMVRRFQRIRPEVVLIRLPRNRGKGHAVRTGALNSRGNFVLLADADGSTPFPELARLRRALEECTVDIAIGSRALVDNQVIVSARWYRRIIGRSFNFLVNSLAVPGVKDTQCGFKLFTRHAARELFSLQTLDGYAFDVELLFLARRLGMRWAEVPVNWRAIAGSKVNLLIDPLKMFFQIILILLRHRKLVVDHNVSSHTAPDSCA
jgi:dolichyl-phosphate beta-glucosyltransferase